MVKQQSWDGGDNIGTHAHIGYIEKGNNHEYNKKLLKHGQKIKQKGTVSSRL